MSLTSEQIDGLMRLVGITREDELNCNECLDQVSELVEYELAGLAIQEALEPVRHHLSLCEECREEYEELLKAMRLFDEDKRAGS